MHGSYFGAHLIQLLLRCGDDEFDSASKEVELGIGDEDCNLNEGIVCQGEAGHLAIDPNEVGILNSHARRVREGDFTPRSPSVNYASTPLLASRVRIRVMTVTPLLPEKRVITTRPRPSDRVFRGVVTSFGLLNVLILSLIGGFLLLRGFEVLRSQGWKFFIDQKWNIDSETGKPMGNFGIGAMLSGTLIASFVAIAVALPISVLTALMLNFYVPSRLRKYFITLIDLMAAFPSILFGLWGYFVLMPSAEYWAKLLYKYFHWIPIFNVPQPFFTRSPFVAGIVLAVMIIPIITSVSREVFSQAPLDRIQAAYALGANKWAMIKAVVLPFGANGAVGGAMLGLGRAFGETVAVYTVLNIVYKVNWHILFGAGGNVASHIVLRWGEAGPYEIKALLAAGFTLFLLTLAVNFLANIIIKRTVKKGR